MRIFFRVLMVLLGVHVCAFAMAESLPADKASSMSNQVAKPTLKFQVGATELLINKSKVESVSFESCYESSSGETCQVRLKLDKKAAKKLESLTTENIGKRINIVFDGRIVSSPIVQSSLGDEFIISGFTKKEATELVGSLGQKKG